MKAQTCPVSHMESKIMKMYGQLFWDRVFFFFFACYPGPCSKKVWSWSHLSVACSIDSTYHRYGMQCCKLALATESWAEPKNQPQRGAGSSAPALVCSGAATEENGSENFITAISDPMVVHCYLGRGFKLRDGWKSRCMFSAIRGQYRCRVHARCEQHLRLGKKGASVPSFRIDRGGRRYL